MNDQQANSLLNCLKNIAQRKAEDIYASQASWNVVNAQGETLWVLERETGLRYPGKTLEDIAQIWQKSLQSHSFWELEGQQKNTPAPLLDSETFLLWQGFFGSEKFLVDEARQKLQSVKFWGLSGWRLPSKSQLQSLCKDDNPALGIWRPLITSQIPRGLFGTWIGVSSYANQSVDIEVSHNLYDHLVCLCDGCSIDFYKLFKGLETSEDPYKKGGVVACHNACQRAPTAFWQQMRTQAVTLVHSATGARLEFPDLGQYANTDWQGLAFEGLWSALLKDGLSLEALSYVEDPSTLPGAQIQPINLQAQIFSDLDYTPCRLPKLTDADMSDVNAGLWELWGESSERLKTYGLRARDPARDLRDEWVAIDFGTSSTVVAVTNANGGKELLRIGVKDFYEAPKPTDYENPTVLEFLDLEKFLENWNQQVYRPSLNWDWVHVAHVALNAFYDNANDPRMVNSVMLYLKRWALESERVNIHILDQKAQRELCLAPLQEENPVLGQRLQPRGDAPLDVIELYAWFLGMVINWRKRGLYRKYALTFPVKYDQQTRDKIRASFWRGLQRSLPESLVEQSAVLNDFEVRNVATEPMAYAVATLPHLGLEETLEGLAYAVFDFGGGATDFDFGLWRLPTPEEEDEYGVESVFERLGSGGDPYLGGENLLALLAYQVVQMNLEDVYKHKLNFTRPDSEQPFVGSETVVAQTSLAQANSAMLIQSLRPLLIEPDRFTEERISLDLLDIQGHEHTVALDVNRDALEEHLRSRIARGVEGFLSEMSVAFSEEKPAQVHILLAGNASRGCWVKECFAEDGEAWEQLVDRYFGNQPPEFVIHQAQGAVDTPPGDPNCKTAVALGALDLVPGSSYLQRDRLQNLSGGEAPFKYFLGPLLRNQLQPVFTPGCPFSQWQELGPVRDHVFVLAWSASPRGRTGMKKGDTELRVKNIPVPEADTGWRCFARVLGVAELEIATASSGEEFFMKEPEITKRLYLDIVE